MNEGRGQQSSSGAPRGDGDDDGPSGLYMLLVLTVITVVSVAGYFFLLKLIDISRQEDCVLGGGRRCASLTLPDR